MGLAQHLRNAFESEFKGEENADYDYGKIYRERLIEFRKEPLSVVRVEKPLNIARARSLGYKAKQGFVVVRVRVRKGSGMHERPWNARRPKRMGVRKLTRKISIQSMAEKKASKAYENMEVLNSYFVGEDGRKKYFEVILVDPMHPAIKSDKDIGWICEKQHRGRGERGLTSAQKKSRGLRRKGKGAERTRPRLRAIGRKTK
ncbi:MAG: 50S ribosomal protein L15e [Candidatus Diapherotrites archaeon]